ncbi:MAG: hypothetical protein CM15mP59_4220 [Flavobacteriaceae bacterium]|nr:MAG: hypothetical protein CM15mP59_4220 [Flavobacteriaceae bacterium]
MDDNFMAQVAKWKKEPFDKETQEKVTALLNNPKALEDAFYTNLSFGTGGMRHHGRWYQSSESIYFWTQHPRTKQLHQKNFLTNKQRSLLGMTVDTKAIHLRKLWQIFFLQTTFMSTFFCASANP